MRTPEQRFRAKIAPANSAGCELWTACTDRDGYGQFGADGRMVKAHRFSWEQVSGPIPDGLQVLHRCDTPSCVCPEHLFLGTNADNVADMVAKGRAHDTRGSRNGYAKLTEAQAVEIFLGSGSHRAIAARFGVSRSLVGQIKRREGWAHASPSS